MKTRELLKRLKADENLKLSDFKPSDTLGYDKERAKKELKKLRKKLCELQEVFYANSSKKFLIILQGTDTSGKDGTVKHVFKETNPSGVKVVSFKEPTKEELAHDFLWRVHAKVPPSGQIGIFNRSHYEDVLVPRVHGQIGVKECKKRFVHIRNFEKLLYDEGTVILKFFLHISKEEQKKRLLKRLENPKKRWKFSEKDIKERLFWDDYQVAYEDAIRNTATSFAPWFIIPADKKWFRNLAVAKIVVYYLKNLKLSYPEPQIDVEAFKRFLEEG